MPAAAEAIIVALIAAGPSYLTLRHSRATRRIVSGNGKGDVAAMLESVIAWQEGHDVTHRRLLARLAAEAAARDAEGLE